MPTKSAGRVSIRVLPDSSRFREDLRVSLERIEKSMKAEIPAILQVTRESILRLKEQLREIEARIKVEPYVTEEQLRELKHKIEGVDPRINANLNAANAQRRLAVLSRDREVTLFVRVNKASAAAAAQTLAALSGSRMVGNLFKDFFDGIKNLDKNAPKIGVISSGIVGLSAVVLAAVSNIGGLIGSFAQLGQAGILLPAIIIGAGAAIGVLVAALKDTKKVLGDLAPLFHKFQDDISSEFWKEAAQPVREFVKQTLGILDNIDGSSTATSLGIVFAKLANSLKANLGPQVLGPMFHNLNSAIDIFGNAMDPIVHAFTVLGTFGTSQLPRLSTWLVKLSTQFNDFITKADSEGKLAQWAETGIKAFKDLGSVIYQAGRVFSALNMAAQRAGGATFEELASGLQRLSDIMRTEGFQKGFETIFAGAHKAVDGLLQGIKNLGPGLSVFAVTMNTVFTEVGKILGVVGENLAILFADPTLNQGIKDFFSGFLTFISELKPAMKPLGEIIGTLATAMGSLLAQAAPLITDALVILAPLFQEIWKAVQPLIPDLIQLADTFIKELGPPLLALVKEVLPPLIPLLKDMIPILADLLKAASPVITDFFQKLGHMLQMLDDPRVHNGFKVVDDLFKTLKDFPLAFFQGSVGDNKGMIGTLIKIAVDHPEVPGFFNALNTALGGVFDKLGSAGDVMRNLGDFITSVQTLASPAGLVGVITVFDQVFQISERWNGFWSGLTTVVNTFIQNLPAPLQGALAGISLQFNLFTSMNKLNWDNFWSGLPGVVQQHMTISQGSVGGGVAGMGLQMATFFATQKPAWTGFWLDMSTKAIIGMAGLAGAVTNGFPSININVFSGMLTVATKFATGWQGVVNDIPGWFNKMGIGVTAGIGVVLARLTGMPNQMIAYLMASYKRFQDAGAALIGGFAAGILGGTNPVVAAITHVVAEAVKLLPHSPAKKGPLSGRGWTLYSGRATVEGFAEGMRSRTGLLQKVSNDAMSAVQLNGGTLSTSSAASAVMGAASSASRALIEIQGDYYGATPEKVANEFDKKLRRAGLVAQLGKVGV